MMDRADKIYRVDLGKKVDKVLEAKKLSVDELSEAIFVSREAIEDLLTGREANIDLVRRVSEITQTPLTDLVDSSNSLEYHSVFISYGGPDSKIAGKFYRFLTQNNVKTFFFAETARYGQRLHRTMSDGVNEYDRVLLLCSKNSLSRNGVVNEIEQVLVREAAEGGSELIIPVTLDKYIFSDWKPSRQDLARQIKTRVVADFTGMTQSPAKFAKKLNKLLDVLKKHS